MPSELERLRLELEGALAGIDDGALTKAPAGKWSGAQILEHLFLSYKNTNRGLAMCLEKGGAMCKAAPTLKERAATLLVANLGYMPRGRKAPQRVLPQGMPPAEARTTIFAEIQKMESGFDDCEHKLGARTKLMDHPFLGPLTARQWRKFHLVHGRHHAKQIRERRKM